VAHHEDTDRTHPSRGTGFGSGKHEYITQASQESGSDAWKNAVLEWHCEAIAKARNEPWIAGLARSHDPIVDRVLRRFHRGPNRGADIRAAGGVAPMRSVVSW